MSRTCSICDKKGVMVRKLVKLRGKFNPTINKKKHPNLQLVTFASGEKVKACAKCIKAMGKTK